MISGGGVAEELGKRPRVLRSRSPLPVVSGIAWRTKSSSNDSSGRHATPSGLASRSTTKLPVLIRPGSANSWRTRRIVKPNSVERRPTKLANLDRTRSRSSGSITVASVPLQRTPSNELKSGGAARGAAISRRPRYPTSSGTTARMAASASMTWASSGSSGVELSASSGPLTGASVVAGGASLELPSAVWPASGRSSRSTTTTTPARRATNSAGPSGGRLLTATSPTDPGASTCSVSIRIDGERSVTRTV